jgi:hypothetical protein
VDFTSSPGQGGLGAAPHGDLSPDFLAQSWQKNAKNYWMDENTIATSVINSSLETHRAGRSDLDCWNLFYEVLLADALEQRGFAVERRHVKPAASLLEILANDPQMAQGMGQRGRKLAEERYDINRYASDLHGFFDSL